MTQSHHDDLYEEEPLPEGEEKAPPLTHTMGIVRWVILGAMTLFALIMILSYFGMTPWSESSGGAQQYHCPMHPTYISSQPGDCPICGMSLVPISSKVDVDSAAQAEHGAAHGKESIAKPGQYYCPMDTEVASDTAGRCPICGMHLEKFEPGMKFTCEMHPEVVTDRPGDCPKCGMDLMPLETDAATSAPVTHATGMGSAPVPGLVPVTLEPQRLQLIGLKTGMVERRQIGEALKLVGYVSPDESKIANVNTRISGWVQKLAVDQTGQRVTKGEPLMTVYSQELYQAIQDHLLALKSSTQATADTAYSTTRHQILEASRERLRLLGLSADEIAATEISSKSASDIVIQSPFDGYVLEKSVVQGQFVTPSQNLFTIADLRTVWILADVYESDLASVRSGQTATMKVAAYPDYQFEGKVSFIYPTVSPETRTLKVRLEFANPNMRLRPGMYADIYLSSGTSSVLAIPREAVMDGGEISYAFVVAGEGRFEPRRITTGKGSGDWVEVTSGLKEHETVVISANFLIDSESRLQAAISGMSGTQSDPHAGHGK